MIDFQNASFLKLSRVGNDVFAGMVQPMMLENEKIISSYKSIRDGIVFTTERIFAINVQGITGKKKDFTSMPYSKVQVFSVETAGTFDFDSELVLWFSGVGKVKFEFTSDSDVAEICKMISGLIL